MRIFMGLFGPVLLAVGGLIVWLLTITPAVADPPGQWRFAAWNYYWGHMFDGFPSREACERARAEMAQSQAFDAEISYGGTVACWSR
jgi:hypothetical protein